MINRVKAYATTDGQTFTTAEAAKRHELSILLQAGFDNAIPAGSDADKFLTAVIETLVSHSDEFIDALKISEPRKRVTKAAKAKVAKAPATPKTSAQ